MTASRARFLARIGGLLYLVIIVIGALGEAVVRGRVVVPDDTAATLANLRTMESLWRLGVAGEIVLLNCALGLGVILYILLRPVSRDLAFTALLFNVACIAIEAVAAFSWRPRCTPRPRCSQYAPTPSDSPSRSSFSAWSA